VVAAPAELHRSADRLPFAPTAWRGAALPRRRAARSG